MNNIVKYHNYLNALEFRKFTALDYDFLMYLCAALRDQGTKEMTFSLSEIKDVINYDHHAGGAEFEKLLKSMNRKLLEITAEVQDGSKTIMFVLFPTFEVDTDSNTLTVEVNERFRFILNELAKNFTQFELAEFTALNSKYSKTLYRLLKQFRSTGEYHVKVEELRKLLGCPEGYETRYLVRDIIAPAVTELQKEFPLLKCEPVKARKRGAPIVGFHFSFEADGQVPGQLTLDQGAEEIKRIRESKGKDTKKPRQNSFNNFQQREIDYDALERELLNQNKGKGTDD